MRGENGGTIRVELKRADPERNAGWRITAEALISFGLKIVRQLAAALGDEIDLAFGRDEAVAQVSFSMLKQVQDRPIAPEL